MVILHSYVKLPEGNLRDNHIINEYSEDIDSGRSGHDSMLGFGGGFSMFFCTGFSSNHAYPNDQYQPCHACSVPIESLGLLEQNRRRILQVLVMAILTRSCSDSEHDKSLVFQVPGCSHPMWWANFGIYTFSALDDALVQLVLQNIPVIMHLHKARATYGYLAHLGTLL